MHHMHTLLHAGHEQLALLLLGALVWHVVPGRWRLRRCRLRPLRALLHPQRALLQHLGVWGCLPNLQLLWWKAVEQDMKAVVPGRWRLGPPLRTLLWPLRTLLRALLRALLQVVLLQHLGVWGRLH